LTSDVIRDYWEAFRSNLPVQQRPPIEAYEAWHFSTDRDVADELADLVRRGIKTATCSLKWVYDYENEVLPRSGDYSIITTYAGKPVCIIQTTAVAVIPFNQVGAEHAYEEGEEDRSYEHWRSVHWEVYTKECKIIGRQPAEDMPVVCEKFKLVYP
jgi:uncharacterized protein YhfF